MEKKKITRRIRCGGTLDTKEVARLRDIREKVQREFPPRDPPRLKPLTVKK